MFAMYFQLLLACRLISAHGTSPCPFVGHTPQKQSSWTVTRTFLNITGTDPRQGDAADQHVIVDGQRLLPSSTGLHPGGSSGCTYAPLDSFFASGDGGTSAVHSNRMFAMYFQPAPDGCPWRG
uniref:Putative secreted protein n=1 Tax=Ixodes ricinus TaxID=34613 RepID=A0A6B0UPF4_IXORI